MELELVRDMMMLELVVRYPCCFPGLQVHSNLQRLQATYSEVGRELPAHPVDGPRVYYTLKVSSPASVSQMVCNLVKLWMLLIGSDRRSCRCPVCHEKLSLQCMMHCSRLYRNTHSIATLGYPKEVVPLLTVV